MWTPERALWLKRVGLGLLVLGLLLLPLAGSRFYIFLAARVLLLALLALSFNLLFGYTGLLSFGHAAFYATGAYASGLILMKMTSSSLLFGILGGTLVATVTAAVIGFFCVRHTRIYFAMLTLAFGMMIWSLAWQWTEVTGGDDGLIGVPRPPLGIPGVFSLNMGPLANYYYVVVVLAGVAIWGLHRLVNSPFGLILQGIRENENRTAFAGIPVRQYRFVAFAISGLVGGLAGALFAPLESTVTPETAHWTTSAEAVLVTLLGGAHTFSGPIVGAVLFVLIREFVERFTEFWLMWFGIILLILVMGFRGGVVGFLATHGWLQPSEEYPDACAAGD